MELSDTIKDMLSDSHEERFMAEYNQLTIRINKLAAMLDKYENKQLDFKLNCPVIFLYQQLSHMIAYQQVLRNRALVEFHKVI